MIAALLQLVAGVFRLGRLMQFIPRPVIAGFLSGIGLTILCTQLPVILGYDVTHNEEGGALGLLWETVRQALPDGADVAGGRPGGGRRHALACPGSRGKLPAPLIAVVVAAVLPLAFGWSRVAVLGELPTRFPRPSLPQVPWELWNELVMAALAIFLLASLESLLSASVVDSLAKGPRTDNDQELIGQGLGNLASALFGGLPVTGVIARSATNIQAGARTRLAACLHALMLLAMMLVCLAPLVARIPLAALAGVLIAVALRMIEVRMLRTLWRGSRAEAARLPDHGRDDPRHRPDRRGPGRDDRRVPLRRLRDVAAQCPPAAPGRRPPGGRCGRAMPSRAGDQSGRPALLRLGLSPQEHAEPPGWPPLPGARPAAGSLPRRDRGRDAGRGGRNAPASRDASLARPADRGGRQAASAPDPNRFPGLARMPCV